MKAAYINEYGPNSRFEIREADKPRPAPREVLVKVEAAGIIFSDVLDKRGWHGPSSYPFPYVPGWEVAGVVEQLGSEVTEFKVGQRVVGTFTHGGYAEYAAVPAKTLRGIPDRCSFQQALVYVINLPVAYLHYHTFGKVQPGETILIHGGAGGVGSMLTQIAKRNDVTVIAVASTDEKLEFCRQMGADHLINYRKTDYMQAVKELTDHRGVDVIFNGVGGSTLAIDPQIIKPITGRWVLIGCAAGTGTIDPYSFIFRSITLRSCSVLTLECTQDQQDSRRFLDEWLLKEPLINPSHIYRLSDINAAFELLDKQHSRGKVVLVP